MFQVFVCGSYPYWLFVTSRGALRAHPMKIDGAVTCFAPFHNVNCPKGFLYFNKKVNMSLYHKFIYFVVFTQAKPFKMIFHSFLNNYVLNASKQPSDIYAPVCTVVSFQCPYLVLHFDLTYHPNWS